jgi:hypothetical protein
MAHFSLPLPAGVRNALIKLADGQSNRYVPLHRLAEHVEKPCTHDELRRALDALVNVGWVVLSEHGGAAAITEKGLAS